MSSVRRRDPARARPGRRDGRHRSRPSRRPRSRPRARRSSWPRPSWPPSRRRPARRRGSAARPCGPSPRGRGQGHERRLVQADEQSPAVDRDRRRDRAARPDGRLRGAGDLEVLRVRQAVADQGRFEGDDRPALRQGRRDLRVTTRRSRMVGPVMPSGSSARGVVSWRAAAPCPASAARWSAAAGDSPAARAVNQPTRNPASNASPAPVVSTAATVAVATSKRWLRSPRPRQDAGALRSALDDRDRREVEQAVLRVAAEERVRLGRGGEDDIRGLPPRSGRVPPAGRPPGAARPRPGRC